MKFLEDMADRMAQFAMKSRGKDVRHLAFCPRCPMTETKADQLYLGKSGKAYCTSGCAEKHGDRITEIYNVKDQKWIYTPVEATEISLIMKA